MFHVQLNRRQKVQSMNLTSEKNEAENLKKEWNISGISYEDTQ